MDHFAGLDVSVKETSVCILDDAGKSGERYANRSSSCTAACLPSCETTRCAGA